MATLTKQDLEKIRRSLKGAWILLEYEPVPQTEKALMKYTDEIRQIIINRRKKEGE